ncbi:MAG TPA: carbohydrate ABC transporter permease [Acidimicrobiales bacterium]|nr:carbohydrate ABC transporter permease [Acidimicrobiales bacterium]
MTTTVTAPPSDRISSPSPAPHRRRQRHYLAPIARHGMLIVASILFFGPFVWMILTSLKTPVEATQYPPTIFPSHWQWHNYISIFQQEPFGRFYFNSILTTTIATAGQIVTSAFAGYAFARLRFPGRNLLFFLMLGALLVPFQVVFVPLVHLLGDFHWLNSYQGLIVPNIPSAFGAFLFRQFFSQFPAELEDAARMDGAGLWRRFTRIIAPLSKSVVGSFGILSFVYNWNNFFFQFVIVNSSKYMTVQLGLTIFQAQNSESQFNLLMAASSLAVVPVVIVFLIFQKQIVRGVTLQGLK